MKKLILGILLLPLAFLTSDSLGMRTLLTTEAALRTVNGGGADYQLARSVALLPAIAGTIGLLALFLIIFGMLDLFLKSPIKNETHEN